MIVPAGVLTLIIPVREAAKPRGPRPNAARSLLVITTAPVRRIFTITGLDRVIAHFGSLEEALAAASSGTESG